MSFLDEALKAAAQAAATAVGGPLAGLAAKELVEEALEEARQAGRFPEEPDADEKGARRADARPDGVGGAHGNAALGEQQQGTATDHTQDGETNPAPAQALRSPAVFQTHGPAPFKHPCRNQIEPGHGGLPLTLLNANGHSG